MKWTILPKMPRRNLDYTPVATYRLINGILGALLLLFIAFIFTAAHTSTIPLPKSQWERITGVSSASTGLTRSFLSMAKGNIHLARAYNAGGPAVFAFFVLQLGMRWVLFYFLTLVDDEVKTTALIDACISIGLFVICFEPFLIDTLRISGYHV